MLYLISLGISEKDISLKGLETAKSCSKIYLENYTSVGCKTQDLQELIGKPIISADRTLVESEKLIKESKKSDICLLIHGDALSATTHLSLIQEAIKQNIPYKILHSSSILTAVAETGLSLYKFGAVGSISFQAIQENIKSPYHLLKNNDSIKLHTLFLLDLDPEKNKYLTIREAVSYLTRQGMDKNRLCIACSRLGTPSQKITASSADKLPDMSPPCCLIIPGELNFFEQEFLENFK